MALTQIELPLLVLPMIAVLARADRRLVEAAEVLGAGPLAHLHAPCSCR